MHSITCATKLKHNVHAAGAGIHIIGNKVRDRHKDVLHPC